MAEDDHKLRVSIGERELTMVEGSLRTSIHELPTADVMVDQGEVRSGPVDYLEPVKVESARGDQVVGDG